jgi:hypothetical protein
VATRSSSSRDSAFAIAVDTSSVKAAIRHSALSANGSTRDITGVGAFT